jgi:RNA polymerase sigma-70 factor (sigma-E family)
VAFLSAPVVEPAGEAGLDDPALLTGQTALADDTVLGAGAVVNAGAILAGDTVLGAGAVLNEEVDDGEGVTGEAAGSGEGAGPAPALAVADRKAGAPPGGPGTRWRGSPRHAAGAWDASDAVTEIYAEHYTRLVRLALLLVHDLQTAEEVVQDAFEAMHKAWRRLREKDKALAYLRQTVVNRSRSVLRHRKVVDLHPPRPAPDEPSAEHAALALIERYEVAAALRHLPERQREAIILRYYADLSEADIARAMGISRGAVKSHTARAMASLKSVLGRDTL